MGYRGYGLPQAEVISEAQCRHDAGGQAVRSRQGLPPRHLCHVVDRASIQEYILRSAGRWSRWAPPAAQKKLFFNLRKLKGQMQRLSRRATCSPERVEKIATRSGRQRGGRHQHEPASGQPGDHSLNAPLRADGEGEWQDWLVDESDDQETELAQKEELDQRREMLQQALSSLNEREREIIVQRRLTDSPVTLEDLSQQFGISRERVRQIEVRAFDKLQRSVRNLAIKQQVEAAKMGRDAEF